MIICFQNSNISICVEISIRDFAKMIVELTGFTGKITWDATYPGGKPHLMLDTTRTKNEFGCQAKTGFREGFQKTINWYWESCPSL
jgi:GDP-L-fucose synthase